MGEDRRMERLSGLAAIVSGVAWAVAFPLVATEATDAPVGLGYDDYNRLLTLPLLLLPIALAGLHSLQRPRLGRWGRVGAVVALFGALLLLVGNVVEFWGVLASDHPVFAIASPRSIMWWQGSDIGWPVFVLGAFGLLAGGLLFAAGMRQATILPAWAAVVVALTGPLLLAAFTAWHSSLALTAAFAAALALGWIVLGGFLLAAFAPRAA